MSAMDTNLTPESRKALAQTLGLNEQYLYQCLTGRRQMKAGEALRCERDSGGAISRKQLRQRDWQAIWPELAEVKAGA